MSIQHLHGTNLNRPSSDTIKKCPHSTWHGLPRTNHHHSKGRPNGGTREKPRIQLCQWLEASHGASMFLKAIMIKYNVLYRLPLNELPERQPEADPPQPLQQAVLLHGIPPP